MRRLLCGALAALAALLLLVLALRWLDPPGGMIIFQWRVASWLTDAPPPQRGRWLKLEEIDPELALAVIAAEDQRFLEHRGFDFVAIAAAWDHNREGGALRGGSTISQQTAKNLFLWRGRSWLRKGLETGCTVLIETLWPKRRILEVYLNLAEFGPGIFGAEAAARVLLKADPARLGRRQATRLAAALPAPQRWDPRKRSPSADKRAAWIAGQMAALGGTGLVEPLLKKD
jgi:monofunctional glycosyltransferase